MSSSYNVKFSAGDAIKVMNAIFPEVGVYGDVSDSASGIGGLSSCSQSHNKSLSWASVKNEG